MTTTGKLDVILTLKRARRALKPLLDAEAEEADRLIKQAIEAIRKPGTRNPNRKRCSAPL